MRARLLFLLLAAGAVSAATRYHAVAASQVSPSPACHARPVYTVDSVRLFLRGPAVMLSATGRAATAGWRVPRLRQEEWSAAGEAVYALVACPPPQFAAQVLTQIGAERRLRRPLTGLRRIVVVAATNRVLLEVPSLLSRHKLAMRSGRTTGGAVGVVGPCPSGNRNWPIQEVGSPPSKTRKTSLGIRHRIIRNGARCNMLALSMYRNENLSTGSGI